MQWLQGVRCTLCCFHAHSWLRLHDTVWVCDYNSVSVYINLYLMSSMGKVETNNVHSSFTQIHNRLNAAGFWSYYARELKSVCTQVYYGNLPIVQMIEDLRKTLGSLCTSNCDTHSMRVLNGDWGLLFWEALIVFVGRMISFSADCKVIPFAFAIDRSLEEFSTLCHSVEYL